MPDRSTDMDPIFSFLLQTILGRAPRNFKMPGKGHSYKYMRVLRARLPIYVRVSEQYFFRWKVPVLI
jgi:hypothetical protein